MLDVRVSEWLFLFFDLIKLHLGCFLQALVVLLEIDDWLEVCFEDLHHALRLRVVYDCLRQDMLVLLVLYQLIPDLVHVEVRHLLRGRVTEPCVDVSKIIPIIFE